MTKPRVLVLTSCTGVKADAGGDPLACEHFARGAAYVEGRHRRDLAQHLLPAEDLYQGQQHLRLMRGIRAAREADTLDLDLRIVSAGYGLITGDQPLAPYECTFQGMPRNARREWANQLGIPARVKRALAGTTALTIVLLGDEYLDACGLDDKLAVGGPTLVFRGSQSALRLPAIPGLVPVRLERAHTRAFRCGLVGLKGEVGGRLVAHLAEEPSRVADVNPESALDALAARGPVPAVVDPAVPALF